MPCMRSLHRLAQLAEGEAKLARLREQRDQLSAQQTEPVDEASSGQD
jgi:hypothetical protein